MKNLTNKEIEFLKAFRFKIQNIYDTGCYSMSLTDIQKKTELSKQVISGLMSSLQAKRVISIDDCNGKPIIYVGYLFEQNEKGEKLFESYKTEIYN